jgi:hypothetical protein
MTGVEPIDRQKGVGNPMDNLRKNIIYVIDSGG